MHRRNAYAHCAALNDKKNRRLCGRSIAGRASSRALAVKNVEHSEQSAPDAMACMYARDRRSKMSAWTCHQ